mmetsp:Transcript_47535/g.57563  ORF Transcript_47535/g.57563 Transcript_47535/m.57563 type:complete len:96 (+) Transcript_47535:118-405(+)
MPHKPHTIIAIPNIAPVTLSMHSLNITMPQKKETITIRLDHVPCATAKPALRMPYIAATPAGTQNIPETIPHGENISSSPNKSTIQHDAKQAAVL